MPDYLNILILGETGVGKSTFINALANYLEFETLDDALDANNLNWMLPCGFWTQIMDRSNPDQEIVEELIQVGSRSDENDGSKGDTATQQTTVYTVTLFSGLKPYTVRLIDTPSIGDIRVENVKKDMTNILTTLRNYDKLQGILILVKSNSARLTVTFRYYVNELFTHLHRSLAQNIVFGFTNARSSNYTPGDTLRPLKKYLSEIRHISLTLSMDTTYCFDSESFRYLAASKSGVEMANKEDFDRSWRQSRDETLRMIAYFKSVPPFETKSTMTINEVRPKISELITSMADISQLIQANVTEQQLKAPAGTTRRQTANSNLDQRLKEYVQERDAIRLAAAKLGLYTERNSITSYNDVTIAYLNFLIDKETTKVWSGGSNTKLLVLKEDLQRYKEAVQTLAHSMEANADAVDLSEAGAERII